MKAYVQSGMMASRRISPDTSGRQRFCMQRLRGFKQVINTLCVFALITIPVTGVVTQSAMHAVLVALSFLLVIWLLEIGERGVKFELKQMRAPRQ